MTTKGFKKNYNMAPYILEDFASGASCVTDNTELKEAADRYLDAKWNLECALSAIDVEIG